MTLHAVLQQAVMLPLPERRVLIKLLVDTLDAESAHTLSAQDQPHSLMELAGLGAEIWQGLDAQASVDELRTEWDHRS
jgi:hypothetical protein